LEELAAEETTMSDVKIEPRPGTSGIRTVKGTINYIKPMAERPRFYANDHSRDMLDLDPRTVDISDARSWAEAPGLDREGFTLVPHKSLVANFRDAEEVARVHPGEIERLLLEVTGADRVVVNGSGVLRFGESSPEAGQLNNSYPARFIHIDCSDKTAAQFSERSRPKDVDRPVRRACHYNVWRVLSPPPQDIPLTVCDARSFTREDLVESDSIFDVKDQPEWSFESWLVKYSPRHRWVYFSDMSRDDALIFKTNDSDPSKAHNVPHSAFDDATCPAGVPTRTSIEMRGVAYWFE
jgi:hypothetical protein